MDFIDRLPVAGGREIRGHGGFVVCLTPQRLGVRKVRVAVSQTCLYKIQPHTDTLLFLSMCTKRCPVDFHYPGCFRWIK